MTDIAPQARFRIPTIPLRCTPRVADSLEEGELYNRGERRESPTNTTQIGFDHLTSDLHIHGSKSPRDQWDDVVVVQLVSEELDDFAL